jgi:hypothetical protein
MASETSATAGKSVLTDSGLSAKTITDVQAFKHGSVVAIKISYSGGSQWIKVFQGDVEAGGTIDWGTGTRMKDR